MAKITRAITATKEEAVHVMEGLLMRKTNFCDYFDQLYIVPDTDRENTVNDHFYPGALQDLISLGADAVYYAESAEWGADYEASYYILPEQHMIVSFMDDSIIEDEIIRTIIGQEKGTPSILENLDGSKEQIYYVPTIIVKWEED